MHYINISVQQGIVILLFYFVTLLFFLIKVEAVLVSYCDRFIRESLLSG